MTARTAARPPLVRRRHVDLCRLSSAVCPGR
ncbi:putative leader peptide [Kineococcus endophyticus]|uniref:Leader peptide n=1 Tax=Kineococcus endophyticus TaxID=1181883 RepID=A0ABV3P8R4_9ACTN